MVTPGEGWAPSGLTAQDTLHMTRIRSKTIPDRSSPGSSRTAPAVKYQGGGEKYIIGTKDKINSRDNIVIGTWNVRTLNREGKLEELAHEMGRYRWNILGLSEVRWKNIEESLTDEGHKFYFSGKEDKHEHGVGLLIHKDKTKSMVVSTHFKQANITKVKIITI